MPCRRTAACRAAFIPFLVACDPDAASTVKAIQKLDEVRRSCCSSSRTTSYLHVLRPRPPPPPCSDPVGTAPLPWPPPRAAQIGADVIELGVPYSDPLADGPVIQAAATRALEHGGATMDAVLGVVRAATSSGVRAPIVMFTYYNPIMARGLDTFCRQIKEAGASGEGPPPLPQQPRCVASPTLGLHPPRLPVSPAASVLSIGAPCPSTLHPHLQACSCPTSPWRRRMRSAWRPRPTALSWCC